ncbi:SRPBCC family protein [Blastococcus haudaquaticus]|uniref:Activator of Hsp90 ATPase homolog 1-like protein n=1 Tax=Blastococcus haudaquaticus TaxID=1938745 RepID=A0A286GQU2_9ACTN|nr:SRPBCC family protein [Blastococcus haudaquaticus]SOD97903.1 Activator of Hsp90 ATPase homolog 1-like protein [Blastococcus haudaquaticus]
MNDIISEIGAAHRGVRRQRADGSEEVVVVIRRSYPADVEDVWDAVTDPERLRRWFLPVSGELRVGGSFQLEGNVGGQIRQCEAPRHLSVTWGMDVSVVDVRLSSEGDRTVLEIEHSVPLEIAGSGAGALYVGPGWDISVRALGNFLRGEVDDDPTAWEGTVAGQRWSAGAIDAWVAAIAASGTATDDEIGAAAGVARAQFTPDLEPGEG